MTGYLLDTNVVSDLVRNPQGSVAQRIRKVGETKVCTSIIVASELRYGAEKKGSQRLTKQLAEVRSALREKRAREQTRKRQDEMVWNHTDNGIGEQEHQQRESMMTLRGVMTSE